VNVKETDLKWRHTNSGRCLR